jgi:type VI secretion system FHA domain protein
LEYTAIPEEQAVTLTLEATALSEAKARDVTRHVFGEEGGTIGRVRDNSWVLTDAKISGQHAQISFRNGVFYIEDTSRNGVTVNSPENRLVRNRPYALKTGDRLIIEPYEIDVWIDAASEPAARQPFVDLFVPSAEDDPFAARREPPRPNVGSLLDSGVGGEVDPLKFFHPVAGRTAAQRPEPSTPPVDDLLDAHYEPPGVLPSPMPAKSDPAAIPQGYDPLAPDTPLVESVTPPPIRSRPGVDSPPAGGHAKGTPSAEPPTIRQPAQPTVSPAQTTPQATPPAPSAPPRDGSAPQEAGKTEELAALLAGAGVPGAAITAELARSLGEILRIVVSGLMDVLQSRQHIKEEFRMDPTMFRPAENNPLKFSVNVEDALHNLLVKRNSAYLGPVDAFADAFADLRDHQLAMLAGIRVAFESMLAEFDADHLQEAFDRQLGKSSFPLVSVKPRYWDLYRERTREMAKDTEVTFGRLFGEEFRQAYEEQFRELKAQRRSRTPDQSSNEHPPRR